MGYCSIIQGRIDLEVPVKLADITPELHPEVTKENWRLPVHFETSLGIDMGDVTLYVVGIVPPEDQDDASYYNFESDVKKFVDAVTDKGVKVKGWIFRIGEENGDVERVGIDDYASFVISEKAQLTFPDGSVFEYEW